MDDSERVAATATAVEGLSSRSLRDMLVGIQWAEEEAQAARVTEELEGAEAKAAAAAAASAVAGEDDDSSGAAAGKSRGKGRKGDGGGGAVVAKVGPRKPQKARKVCFCVFLCVSRTTGPCRHVV
jgi:hypothetical protein